MDRELLDLGYRFRNAKLWKTIYEDELLPFSCAIGRLGIAAS